MAPPTLAELQSLRAPLEDQSRLSDTDYHNHLVNVVNKLSKLDLPQSAAFDELVINLDPFLDTLPCLFLLDGEVKRQKHNAVVPGNHLWARISVVSAQCDPFEVRYAMAQWERLMDSLLESAGRQPVGNAPPQTTLRRAATAICRIDNDSPTLRPVHLKFVRSCIAHEVEHVALEVLNTDLQTIPNSRLTGGLTSPTADKTSSDELSLIEIQQFYVLGGLCYVRGGDWDRAAYMFEHCVLMPSQNVANGLMLEAYKKWLLTSLLAGRFKYSNAMRMVNQAALKSLRALSKAYTCLVDACGHSDPLKVQAVAYEGVKMWQDDSNQGLVNEILELRKREAVSSIQRVYAAMPIDEVASRLGMTEDHAGAYVTGLIAQGQLAAEMIEPQSSGHKTILQFNGRADGGAFQNQTEQELLEVLKGEKALTAMLTEQASQSTQSLEMTVENLESTRRGRSNLPGKGEAEEESMDLGFGGPDSEDENVMAT